MVMPLRASSAGTAVQISNKQSLTLTDPDGNPDGNLRLASVDERIRSLERAVYEPRATALGIKNPDIRQISLQPNEQFNSSIGPNIKVRYTIVKVEPNRLTIKMDGWVMVSPSLGITFFSSRRLIPGRYLICHKESLFPECLC